MLCNFYVVHMPVLLLLTCLSMSMAITLMPMLKTMIWLAGLQRCLHSLSGMAAGDSRHGIHGIPLWHQEAEVSNVTCMNQMCLCCSAGVAAASACSVCQHCVCCSDLCSCCTKVYFLRVCRRVEPSLLTTCCLT